MVVSAGVVMMVVELVVPEAGMVVLLLVSAGVVVVELVVPAGVVVVVVLEVSVFLLQPANAKTATKASAATLVDFFKESAYISVSFLKNQEWPKAGHLQCSHSRFASDGTGAHASVRIYPFSCWYQEACGALAAKVKQGKPALVLHALTSAA